MPITLCSILERVESFDYLIREGRIPEASEQAWMILGYRLDIAVSRSDLYHICEGFGWAMFARTILLDPKRRQGFATTEEQRQRSGARATLTWCQSAVDASNYTESRRLQRNLRRRCAELVVESHRMIEAVDTVETDELADALARMAVFDLAEALGVDMGTDDEIEGHQKESDAELDRLLARAMGLVCVDHD